MVGELPNSFESGATVLWDKVLVEHRDKSFVPLNTTARFVQGRRVVSGKGHATTWSHKIKINWFPRWKSGSLTEMGKKKWFVDENVQERSVNKNVQEKGFVDKNV